MIYFCLLISSFLIAVPHFRPMNRRDFLHPGHLANTAGELLGLLNEPLPDKDSDEKDDIALLRFSRQAMATSFEVIFPFGIPGATQAAEAALDEIDRIEDQLTVYRETSEVSRLNRLAAVEPVTVTEDLFQLLTESAQLTEQTEGAFDVATGALIKAWGFHRRLGRVPSAPERADVADRTGMKNILLDSKNRMIRFLKPGVEINFGSIGKGYALDQAAKQMRSRGIRNALLHGGHSSVCAIGTGPERGRGWPIGIRHPWKPDQRLATVRLKDRALGTSAATFQHLEHEGRKLGHILDPRTCWPAENMVSASVVAPTAALADALATAFFILGVDKARLYCENHPEIAAVLLSAEESAQPVVVGSGDDPIQLASADPTPQAT